MMDYDALIDQLSGLAHPTRSVAQLLRQIDEAIVALKTLRAENDTLRRERDDFHAACHRYLDVRDAAINTLRAARDYIDDKFPPDHGSAMQEEMIAAIDRILE